MGWDDDDFYQAWQLISSTLRVVVVALIAWWWLSRTITISAVTIGYDAGWGVSSIPGDESGLSLVGLVMVLVAVLAAATLLVVLADTAEAELRRARLR